MARLHEPPEEHEGAEVIPFPGVAFAPSSMLDDPEDMWTECEYCGEELMVGDTCVWCNDGEDLDD